MEDLKQPKSLAEIQQLIKPIRNINAGRRENLSRLDRIAVWITDHVGTMGFFLILFVWTFLWLGWNIIGPRELRFDPYPGFVLWLFLSNMIQLFLMPLLLIGQNLQGSYSEARAEADFEVNTRAELEIETILLHLENQNKLILQILASLKKAEVKIKSEE
jgi:uncharacterized membrane protein